MSHGDSLRSQKKSANAAGSSVGVPELDAAYRATLYRVDCPGAPGGCLPIRVGAMHPPVDAWLDRVGVDCWAYLSAENPASRRLPADENARRSAALRQALEQSGKPFLPARRLPTTASGRPKPVSWSAGWTRRKRVGWPDDGDRMPSSSGGAAACRG